MEEAQLCIKIRDSKKTTQESLKELKHAPCVRWNKML